MSNFQFDPQTRDFSLVNAYALARAAKLAYSSPDEIGSTVQDEWEFDRWMFFDRDSTQGFIAHKSTFILLSFRGTEPTQLEDWIVDANAGLKPGLGGQVHNGFYQALMSTWEEVRATLSEYREEDASRPIWITGHSLGAALGTLAAAQLLFEEQQDVQGLYTFGCPRVGDANFASEFDQRFQAQAFRFVNNNDVVPRVPPSLRIRPYAHVGTLKYFDADGQLRETLGWWIRLLDRLRGRIDDFGNLGTDGMNDHSISGYETLVESTLQSGE
ncbi:MAG: lipase family protein [Candidatus Tectomicrobia bacterium]|nr:lipase family protein [Candidatus Tectomicrobia bacterium]